MEPEGSLPRSQDNLLLRTNQPIDCQTNSMEQSPSVVISS